MKEQFIELTDGSRLAAKINFGTLYYLNQSGADQLAKKIDKKQKRKQKISDRENMEFAAKVVYAILRSNGKEVTFDEAMMLMPPDEEAIQKIIDVYSEEMERRKKKQKAKAQMKRFAQK